MHFALAVAIAVSFWGARDVRVPCHPVPQLGADAVLPLDRLGTQEPMGAVPSTCTIYLSTAGSAYRHIDPEFYCQAITHEVGHLSGLGHTPTGIMRGDRSYSEDAPYDCTHWRHYAKVHRIPLRR